MEHLTVRANGASFHVARAGEGPPLLLLHGWPEFWLAWEPLMRRLQGRHTLLAPDLRGFGASDKPPPGTGYGAAEHAADLLAILDELAVPRVGIVGHDVGSAVMQPIARQAPGRVAGLFFFDCVHPFVGRKLGTPDRLIEIWYQSFHQVPMAPALVGSSREACAIYFGHFLRHWCHRKHAFDPVFDAFVDNFMAPGNLDGGFAYYRAANAGRLATMRGETPDLPAIAAPTCVRWGEHDPILRFDFSEGLEHTFADLDLARFPGVGHFPHMEDPDRAADEVAGFFARIGW